LGLGLGIHLFPAGTGGGGRRRGGAAGAGDGGQPVGWCWDGGITDCYVSAGAVRGGGFGGGPARDNEEG
jgi:hypothetical protein